MKNFHPGEFIKKDGIKSFIPSKIHKEWILDDQELQFLLSRADRQIGRLDMYSEHIPNIELFVSMHIRWEATQSSKIEGTQTNIEDAFLNKQDIAPELRNDWQEVSNYITALNDAIDRLKEWPFSSRLITNTHKILMQGVRGQNKNPGEFRQKQNWIGGATITDATFVPPPHEMVKDLIADLEAFANDDENFLPPLLKIALIHYQFETIHPFLDGNGRIGRLLITLYLAQKGILKKPVLYLSDFFEQNKQLYYDNLNRVRLMGDIKQWFKFFLVGIIETAKNGVDSFDKIMKLKQAAEDKIQKQGKRSGHLLSIMKYLYKSPVINAPLVINLTGVSQNTAYRLLEDLELMEILTEISRSPKTKVYWFKDYISIFK